MVEGFIEPCEGTPVYSEIVTKFGARVLVDTCTCGKEVASHLLFSESEIRFWCDTVITKEMAIEGMSEYRMCHNKGVTYSAYMGIRENGDDMTDEEYAPILERIS